MRCANCNKDFEAKRKTAKFCSDKCRVYASRHTLVTLGTVGESVKVLKEEPLGLPDISRNDLINGKAYRYGTEAYEGKFCRHGKPVSFCKFATGKPCK